MVIVDAVILNRILLLPLASAREAVGAAGAVVAFAVLAVVVLSFLGLL